MHFLKKIIVISIIGLMSISLFAQNLVKQEREVSGFNQITIGENIEVVISQGVENKVVVECDAGVQDKIDAFVSNANLKIQVANGMMYNSKPKLYITFKNIYKITLNGGSDLKIPEKINLNKLAFIVNGKCTADINVEIATVLGCKVDEGKIAVQGNAGIFNGNLSNSCEINVDIDADKVRCTIEEGAKAIFSGSSDLIFANISGGGSLESYGMQSEKAKISIFGESKAYVTVLRELHVIADGNCKVYYKGKPDRVKAEKSGGAEVVAED